jgi:hypothetical protein
MMKTVQTAPDRLPTAGALPIVKYARAYGVHPTTVWRALKAGRLEYVVIGKRKLILPPVVQRDDPDSATKRPQGRSRSRRKN